MRSGSEVSLVATTSSRWTINRLKPAASTLPSGQSVPAVLADGGHRCCQVPLAYEQHEWVVEVALLPDHSRRAVLPYVDAHGRVVQPHSADELCGVGRQKTKY